MVQIIRDIKSLRRHIAQHRAVGKRVALVPTMGALHDGHMALVAQAHGYADTVVTSIFVNPTQFGPNEDLARYPRQEAQDIALLEQAGCTTVWAPDVATMYPHGHDTMIKAGALSKLWDGAARPGHFDAVATIVAKLFNQVTPDVALFGEKDWQQLAVIRHVAADLDIAITIIGVPTERAGDGLALSSRNAYLSADERAQAPRLYQIMKEAGDAIGQGGHVNTILDNARAQLSAAGFSAIDYFALVDASDLQPLTEYRPPARIIAAARLGKTRLIDNIAIGQE